MSGLIKRYSTARYYARVFHEHSRELEQLRQLLCDRASLDTLQKILSAYTCVLRSPEHYFRSAACAVCSEHHFIADNGYVVRGTQNPYFLSDIFRFDSPMVLLDGGAYVGDTVELLLGRLRLPCSRVYAFEPNPRNFAKLTAEAAKHGDIVRCLPYGLDDRDAVVGFSMDDAGSRIDSNGCDTVEVIDTGAFLSRLENDLPTFLKLDIEGKEQDVLESARNYIAARKPDLAVSIYHRLEDLWEIPLLIHDICPEYRIYIRHQSNYFTETVCYAAARRA